jgi:hypothetical protein
VASLTGVLTPFVTDGSALTNGAVALWALVGNGTVPIRINIAKPRMEMILLQ